MKIRVSVYKTISLGSQKPAGDYLGAEAADSNHHSRHTARRGGAPPPPHAEPPSHSRQGPGSNCRLALAFLVAPSQDKFHSGRAGHSRGAEWRWRQGGGGGTQVEAGWQWAGLGPMG